MVIIPRPCARPKAMTQGQLPPRRHTRSKTQSEEDAAAASEASMSAQEPTRVAASYANCSEVKAAGAAPIHAGDPGWQSKFDRDGDGVGCES